MTFKTWQKASEQIDLDNPELQKALQIIQYTRRSLFLTGKAGTGKSTFLRYICNHTKKKHVVLAPTGIAAINAGGSTLHSFFKLPFHPLLPNDTRYNRRNIRETLKYNGEKRKILRELELIIIDEISMVQGRHHRLHRQGAAHLLPQHARALRRQAAAAGGRHLPAGARGQGGRPPVAAALLPQFLFLRCQGVQRDAAGEHRAAQGVSPERPCVYQHPRPHPHQPGHSPRPPAAQRTGRQKDSPP